MKKIPNIIKYLFVFLIGSLLTFFIIHYYHLDSNKSVSENIIKTIKDVTITDTGIADAELKWRGRRGAA